MKIKHFLLNFLFIALSYGQNNVKITGFVLDKDTKKPLELASVFLKGTGYKTDTNAAGKYELQTKPGAYTLVFSFIGYKSFEKNITVTANQTLEINASLQENTSKIDEVVIKVAVKNKRNRFVKRTTKSSRNKTKYWRSRNVKKRN